MTNKEFVIEEASIIITIEKDIKDNIVDLLFRMHELEKEKYSLLETYKTVKNRKRKLIEFIKQNFGDEAYNDLTGEIKLPE